MKYTMQNIQESWLNCRVLGYLYVDYGYSENTLCFVVVIYCSLGIATYRLPFVTQTEPQEVKKTEKPTNQYETILQIGINNICCVLVGRVA